MGIGIRLKSTVIQICLNIIQDVEPLATLVWQVMSYVHTLAR